MFSFIEDRKRNFRHRYLENKNRARLYFNDLYPRYTFREYRVLHEYRRFRELVREAKWDFERYLLYKNFDKEATEKSIMELLDYYFPEKWDIQDDSIIIFFPEVTITDGYGKTRLLTDIYIKISIYGLDSDEITVRGTRMSHTPGEVRSKYSHSHFSSNSRYEWGDVCFGNFKYCGNTLLNGLTLLLMNLQQFLETESTFTNPYCTIGNIGNFEDKIYPGTRYTFKPCKITYDIEIEYWEGIPMFVPVDNTKLDLYLMDHYETAVVFKNGAEYFYRNASTSSETYSRDPIQFKGKQIEWELKPNQEELPETVINPYLKSKFIEYAKLEITKDVSLSLVTKDQADNIGQPVSEDTVPVQQNIPS